ncbi:MAG: type II toxin-antitoxin system prevent-host-death family antitoxin [Verrucomicrobiota bacterium]
MQDAKQRFSEVAARAARGRAQVVTQHGKPFVVILGIAEWKEFRPQRRTLIEGLRSCPADLTTLVTQRSREQGREVEL